MKSMLAPSPARCTGCSRAFGAFFRSIPGCLFLLLALVAPGLLPAGRAATIVDRILLPDGNPYIGHVIFRPATNRVITLPPGLVTAAETTATTDTNGNLSQVLSPNHYMVSVGGSLPFRIAVPDSTNRFTLAELSTNVLALANFDPGGVADLGTKLTKTGDTIGGTFAVGQDLVFDGDPVTPNTNWTRTVDFRNLDNLGNSQTKTVSWQGKELGELYGGTTIIGGYTNLIFDTPDTFGDFTDATKLWALGPVDPATGLRVTRAYTLDQLGLTDSSFSGKVIGIDPTTKRLTKSSVALTDVASATALAATNAALMAQITAVSNSLNEVFTEGLVTSGNGFFVADKTGNYGTGRVELAAMADSEDLILLFSGWYTPDGTATPNPDTIRVKCSLQIGSTNAVALPVTFGGVRNGVIQPASVLRSDPIIGSGVSAGQKLYLNVYQSDSTSLQCTRYLYGANGEQFDYNVDRTDSPTYSTSVEASKAQAVCAPYMVIGRLRFSDKKGVGAMGDSIIAGTGSDYVANRGFAGVAIGSVLPFVNFGAGGSTANNWANPAIFGAYQNSLRYLRSVFVQPGRNDINSNSTLAQITNSLTTIVGQIRACGISNVIGCTIAPDTTSSDNWLTTANQSPRSWNSVRVAVNGFIRSSPLYNGYFDLDAALRWSGDTNVRIASFSNATNATQLFSVTAGASSSGHAVYAASASTNFNGAIVVANSTSAYVTAVNQGTYYWLGYDKALTVSSGDTVVGYDSFTADGTHLSGYGTRYVANQMNITNLFIP